MSLNGWWIEQFVTENRDGQNNPTGRCDLRVCGEGNRVWSRIGMTTNQQYYTRFDIPYYGHPKKTCKECERP